MASLPIALDSTSAEPMALARTETRASDNRGDFDQVERSDILLSRNDPWLSRADPQGRTTRVLRCMGFRTPNRLADARLEALQRHAIILRPGARARRTCSAF